VEVLYVKIGEGHTDHVGLPYKFDDDVPISFVSIHKAGVY